MRRLGIVGVGGAAPCVLAASLFGSGCTAGEPAVPGGGPYGGDASTDAGAGGGIDACTQIPRPDGGAIHVTGTVVVQGDASPPTPIANAMIATEYGGLYIPYCDLTTASPYYLFGAVTDSAGHFEIDVQKGMLGFHSFATGYFYSRAALDTSQGTDVVLTMEALPPVLHPPVVTNAGFDNPTVAAGASVTFRATLATANPYDPLSDENVLVEPTHSWGHELSPPSVGRKDNFPDGVWQRTFAAPIVPGTYTYYFSATTAGCVTSAVETFALRVQ